MFSKTIIDSDAFQDMSLSARLLYFELGMRADDDGFVNAPRKITRMAGASEDDLRILCARGFLIPFDSGVVAIRHWRVHNYIRKDTYRESACFREKALLTVDESGGYCLSDCVLPEAQSTGKAMSVDDPSTGNGISVDDPSTGNGMSVDAGKDRIGKERTGQVRTDRAEGARFVPPRLEEVKAFCAERHSCVDPQEFYDYFTAGDWTDAKGQRVRAWKQKLMTWEKFAQRSPPGRQRSMAWPGANGGDSAAKISQMERMLERMKEK